MQSLSFVPLNALFLGNPDQTGWRQHTGSQGFGSQPQGHFGDIVLPLIRPGIWVALLLSFVRSLADFGTPVIIGGRFSTIASEIYLQLVGYSNLEKASAMNMVLMLPSIAAFFLYRKLMKRSDMLTEGRGGGRSPWPFHWENAGRPGFWQTWEAYCSFYDGSAVRMYIHIRFPQKHQGVYSFTTRYLEQMVRLT